MTFQPLSPLPDGTPEVIAPGAFTEEFVEVPLVAYINGKRHVIGEAVIRGSTIHTTMNPEDSEELLSALFGNPTGEFSIGFSHPALGARKLIQHYFERDWRR